MVDPVLPRSLDGLRASLHVGGRPVTVAYSVGARDSGPSSVVLNGRQMAAVRLTNPYRTGGFEIEMDEVHTVLRPDANHLDVTLP